MRDDQSELGGLRRDQRRVLRGLPAVVKEQLDGIAGHPEFLDLRRAEWVLRKTAAVLLRDFPADLACIAAACDALGCGRRLRPTRAGLLSRMRSLTGSSMMLRCGSPC